MEWTARIEREGEYEILAYIPRRFLRIEWRSRREVVGEVDLFYFSFFCNRNGAGRDKTALVLNDVVGKSRRFLLI